MCNYFTIIICVYQEGNNLRSQLTLTSAPPAPSITNFDLTCSLILAVSVCYHARLTNRTDYEKKVAGQFTAPLALSRGVEEFRNVIKWYVRYLSLNGVYKYLISLNQVPRNIVGEYGVRGEYCSQCCSERECVHDGCVCGPQDTSFPCWKAWKFQVTS